MDQSGSEQLRNFLKKHGSVLSILFIGIALMLLPTPQKESQVRSVSIQYPETQPPSLQEQLTEILLHVEGAGKVNVLLTISSGEKTIYQTDTGASGTDTVILTDSIRNQVGLIAQIEPPKYLGAVIVCQGADRPAVRLAITQAVSSVTGLGYDKITILKMK